MHSLQYSTYMDLCVSVLGKLTHSMANLPRLFRRQRNRASAEADDEPPMNISAPTNVTHDCHVGFDVEKNTFTGLPVAWKQWLQESNIG